MAANVFLDLPGGFKMPAIGLGTWQSRDEADIEFALNTALEAGYRHIDTAYGYQNEKFIGKVLQQWFASGKLKREDVFITTKLPGFAVRPDRVEQFMKKSLHNLQLDYVDLYLIHFPICYQYDEITDGVKFDENKDVLLESKTDHGAVWKKMEDQVDAGRTRSIGLSNFNISQIETILKSARIKPANLQVELHIFLQQRSLVEFCHKNGLTVVAFSPLANPGYNKFLKGMGREEKELPDILTNAVVMKIAKKHSKTTAQVALRFLIQRGLAPIPKSVSAKRIQENIALFDFALDDTDMKELFDLEIGEKARVCDFNFSKRILEHPDYPIKN